MSCECNKVIGEWSDCGDEVIGKWLDCCNCGGSDDANCFSITFQLEDNSTPGQTTSYRVLKGVYLDSSLEVSEPTLDLLLQQFDLPYPNEFFGFNLYFEIEKDLVPYITESFASNSYQDYEETYNSMPFKIRIGGKDVDLDYTLTQAIGDGGESWIVALSNSHIIRETILSTYNIGDTIEFEVCENTSTKTFTQLSGNNSVKFSTETNLSSPLRHYWSNDIQARPWKIFPVIYAYIPAENYYSLDIAEPQGETVESNLAEELSASVTITFRTSSSAREGDMYRHQITEEINVVIEQFKSEANTLLTLPDTVTFNGKILGKVYEQKYITNIYGYYENSDEDEPIGSVLGSFILLPEELNETSLVQSRLVDLTLSFQL